MSFAPRRQSLVAAAAAGGVSEYDTWADLPASADDGAEALVGGTLHTYREAAGLWLPWYLPGSTLDAARSFDLEDALADITGRGAWVVNDAAAVSKAAGDPLQITGSGVGIAFSCTPPTADCTVIFRSLVGSGVGAGTAARTWGYFGRDSRLFEFLLPNATETGLQPRNPSNGSLLARRVEMGSPGLVALAFLTAGARSRIVAWSPDDTAEGDVGIVLHEADTYPSGLTAWRLYRSVASPATTRFLLQVLT
jgi:hypothetical protein